MTEGQAQVEGVYATGVQMCTIMPKVVKGSFVGKKWGSGWSHMMGEIWIHGEKGAQAVTEPEKRRQAQSVLLRLLPS